MRLSEIHLTRYTVLITVCILMLGMTVGYYLGYDHGWEKAVEYLKSSSK
jgi:hypothetical protein